MACRPLYKHYETNHADTLYNDLTEVSIGAMLCLQGRGDPM